MKNNETREFLRRQADHRLHPSLTNPNYLVLSRRRKIFSEWIKARNPNGIHVLDVGGRLQPYRPLLETRTKTYIGLDIVSSPYVNVVASAELLPIRSDTFDVVICTQAFEYFTDPLKGAKEIHRVLKPGGFALLSFASFYPRATDEERWRFLPRGLQYVLSPFSRINIVPEGSSIVGFSRACAVCFAIFSKYPVLRTLVGWTLVPLLNSLGNLVEQVVPTRNDQASGNFSVLAEK